MKSFRFLFPLLLLCFPLVMHSQFKPALSLMGELGYGACIGAQQSGFTDGFQARGELSHSRGFTFFAGLTSFRSRIRSRYWFNDGTGNYRDRLNRHFMGGFAGIGQEMPFGAKNSLMLFVLSRIAWVAWVQYGLQEINDADFDYGATNIYSWNFLYLDLGPGLEFRVPLGPKLALLFQGRMNIQLSKSESEINIFKQFVSGTGSLGLRFN